MKFCDIFDFYNKIKGMKIAFIGIGVSHRELIKICAENGALVTLCDKRNLDDIKEKDELMSLGVKFKTGPDYLKNVDADIVFRTPGMYFLSPALDEIKKSGAMITSEMELFFEFCPCKIYAITGSDGKTTTSNVIATMLKQSGKTVHLGGNLGRALLPICHSIKKDDVAVVELSSFQLISMRKSADVAVITNLSPNHLDVHHDMQEYIDSKKNIFIHQNSSQRLVLNLDNEETYKMRTLSKGSVNFFSYANNAHFIESDFDGAFLDENGDIFLKSGSSIEKIMHKSLIKIPGEHNVENYLTAISAVGNEVGSEIVRQVAATFSGVEHRIEYVKEVNGVKFYNDSIASSPTRTIAGLKSFSQKLILIAGGYDKNLSYAPLAPIIKENVKLLITMGNTADKIETAVKDDTSPLALPEIIRVNDMNEAVKTALIKSQSGDIVILSPASASFDKYRNFEERGRHFKDIVNAL